MASKGFTNVSLFQFHKGTIKTLNRLKTRCVRELFQFHKGTIKTSKCGSERLVTLYFNSIKVRLKPLFGDM